MDWQLKPLSVDDGQDIYDMLMEMPVEENGFINDCHGKDADGYRKWLQKAADMAKGIGLEAWMVPQSTFWLYADGKPVGYGKLRHRLTDKLLQDGGHIGYGIRPSARGQGHGAALLSFLIEQAGLLGIGSVLVTISARNEASIRTAQGNGGVLREDADANKKAFWISTELSERIRTVLKAKGAALVGFADLQGLPADIRAGYPRGIAIGLPWDKEVLRGIENGPTQAYHDGYDQLNERLDALDTFAQNWLTGRGYRAQGQTRAVVGSFRETDYKTTALPHKTVATRAGLGWIGKCALLITPEFGSGLRISSIFTDAPFLCARPIDTSQCRGCTICQEICPGGAVSGKTWYAGLEREAFWDAARCAQAARARSLASLGESITLCGLCILRCPWTQKYLRG